MGCLDEHGVVKNVPFYFHATMEFWSPELYPAVDTIEFTTSFNKLDPQSKAALTMSTSIDSIAITKLLTPISAFNGSDAYEKMFEGFDVYRINLGRTIHFKPYFKDLDSRANKTHQ